MSAYRFCRTDDVPLLVRAYNGCYRVHFAGLPELTVEGFKRWTHRLNLWASSCMVAFEGAETVAVLLAAKRDAESLVLALGVRAAHQRRGHGRHLLTSLRQKAAILGPPRLVAELAPSFAAAARFLEACGFEAETAFTDHLAGGTAPAAATSAQSHAAPSARDYLVTPIRVAELLGHGLLDPLATDPPRAWARQLPSLRAAADELEAAAVVSDVRVEAATVFRREPGDELAVLACATAAGAPREQLAEVLLRHLLRSTTGRVRLCSLAPGELAPGLLDRLGFAAAASVTRYRAAPVQP